LNTELLKQLLSSPDQSTRLKVALTAGTYPNIENIAVLIEQSRHENDFFVRDMLTWALIRNDHTHVAQALALELNSEIPQARSQALHTLSKLGNKNLYRLITKKLLLDVNDMVACTAWRAASVLVAENEIWDLVLTLTSQLGRGNLEIQLSLSRSLCSLGKSIIDPLENAMSSPKENVRIHAGFTLKLLENPELERVFTLEFANRIDAINGAPVDQKLLEM